MDAIELFKKFAERLRDDGLYMIATSNNNGNILAHISDVIEEIIEEIEKDGDE